MLEKYIQHLKNRGYSPVTIRAYSNYLGAFLRKYEKPTDETVEKYRKEMAGLNQSTINLKLTILRNYCKWCECYDFRKIELGKVRSKETKIESVEKIREAIDAESDEKVKVILELLLTTGMRLSEMTNLDTKYLDRKKCELQIVGKGGKARVVFIKPELQDKLDLVKGLDNRLVQRVVKKAGKRVGIENLHPHMLRHIFATRILDNNVDIKYVQKMLGHSSIASTQHYTHVTDGKLKEIWNKVEF